jgi:hypothetical protein
MTRYLLLFDSYGHVFLGRPFWLEDRFVFVYAAGPRQHNPSCVWVPWDSWPYFTLRFETSLFVATYDSQGYGGSIRARLHTGEELTIQSQSYVTTDSSVGQSVLE